ncbi:hypothetical protein LJY25_13980 [Hymenobacter sp. BT175]|uniref:hypothetical protein n=1 Tax=Hymenobacter translucens TaxID=2886507 RepID=UPI001D0E0F9D|nr:hypothetical protein [Hymenobacter translucens]MCC2547561.1 hypothetical protein [Hymenobacter translucens]
MKSRTKTYALRDSAGFLLLPFIPANDTLELTIDTGYKGILITQIQGWRLQPGATVSVGRLTNFRKVLSIAREGDYQVEDVEYADLNIRYRIAPEGSILDLPNVAAFKSIDYTVLIGYQQGTLVTSWQGQLKKRYRKQKSGS